MSRLLHTLSRPAMAALILMCLAPTAWAQLKIEGTRLIYQGSDKEASINVVNRSGLDTVMQSWVSSPDEGGDAPFAIVQPLTLIPPNGQQMLRVLYAGQGLPEDRESLFWLNILEIPRKPEQADTLQFAIRQRLKLFYRPAGLPGSASKAVNGLEWRTRQPGRIEVSNPSAFHVSLVDLQLDSPGQSHPLADYVLLRPGESLSLETPSPLPVQSRVAFSELTDIGLQKRHHVALP
ncbi:fimbrial biogenesis chaperone [Pseudomonas sp. LS.1a]|uniref:fimbrial biogenesis chaperone n=1 Tax=Pseudomonas sp. LS.1a TaxID=2920387 RepID=UPI001F144CB4|nr:molecular chaperone [Pseudomonas sp. LS.1a]UMY63100.1 molecular chaperone [Pseudomonas sp. LS.1a]